MPNKHSDKSVDSTHLPEGTEHFYGGEECLRRVKVKAVSRLMEAYLPNAKLADLTALYDALVEVERGAESGLTFIESFLFAVGFVRCDK